MKSAFLGCFGGLIVTLVAFADDDRRNSEVIVPVSATVLSAALDRADVAVARSVITPNALKGEFAEGLTNGFISSGNGAVGKWQIVSPRLGPQGFDHIAVRMNSQGHPIRLMVGETKYGTSQLGQTKNGIQMGHDHTTDRLMGLANRLKNIGAQVEAGISTQTKPPNLNQRYEVVIPVDDQTSVTFWRSRLLDNEWKYDGPQELLPKVQTQLKLLSDYINGAADGRISFSKRIFAWKPKGSNLLLTVRNADVLQEGMSIASLPAQELPPIRLSDIRVQSAFKNAYSTKILNALPGISEKEALLLADEVYTVYAPEKTVESLLARRSFAGFAGGQSLKAGAYGAAITAPIELLFQAFGPGPVDWSRVAGVSVLSGGGAAAGTFSGNFTTYGLMKSQFGSSLTTETAEILGLRSASQVANLSGAFVGGGIASGIFAYGGYFLGYYEIKTANRLFIAGTAASGAFALVPAAMMGAASLWGTAGTGTAIATLHGAALANTAGAWLGGGTLASGGFGIAGGSIVVTAGAAIIAIAVSGAVMYGFHLYDEKQDCKRIELTLSDLSKKYSSAVGVTNLP